MPPAPHPDRATTERIARHLRICAELAELGMQLAEAAAMQALALPPATSEDTPPEADPALTFVRISRAVRQTIALESRIAAGHEADQGRATEIAFNRIAAAARLARPRSAPLVEGYPCDVPDFLKPVASPAPNLFAAISKALDTRPPDGK